MMKADCFLKCFMYTNTQIQDAQRIPSKVDSKFLRLNKNILVDGEVVQ